MYAAASVTTKWRLGSRAYYRLAARQSGDGFVVVRLLLAMFDSEIDDSMNDGSQRFRNDKDEQRLNNEQ